MKLGPSCWCDGPTVVLDGRWYCVTSGWPAGHCHIPERRRGARPIEQPVLYMRHHMDLLAHIRRTYRRLLSDKPVVSAEGGQRL